MNARVFLLWTAAAMAAVASASNRFVSDGSNVRGGLDFMYADGLEMPDDSGRNLLQNSSFEADLRGWNYAHGRTGMIVDAARYETDFFVRDTAERIHGRHSLRCFARFDAAGTKSPNWAGANGAINLASQPIVCDAGTYTFSFWAKGDRPNTGLYLWFPSVTYSRDYKETNAWVPKTSQMKLATMLTTGWRRYVLTFDLPKADAVYAAFNCFCTDEAGTVWIDALQLEKGAAATDYAPPVAEAQLVTSAADDFISETAALDARLEITTDPQASGTVRVELRDFTGAQLDDRTFGFAADADGLAAVALPWTTAELGKGLYVLKYTFAAGGRTRFQHDRFAIAAFRNEDRKRSGLFANLYGDESMRVDAIRLFDRYRKLGLDGAYWVISGPSREIYRRCGRDAGAAHLCYLPSSGPKWGVFEIDLTKSTKSGTSFTPDDPWVRTYILSHRDEGVPLDDAYLARFKEAVRQHVAANMDVARWEFINEFSASVPASWWSEEGTVAARSAAYAKYLKAYVEGGKAANPDAVFMPDPPCYMSDYRSDPRFPYVTKEEQDYISSTKSLISACTALGFRMDAIAHHFYRPHAYNPSPEDEPSLEANIQDILGHMDANGYPQEKNLHLGEGMHWGPYEFPSWGLRSTAWGGLPDTWHGNLTLSYDVGTIERRSAAWRCRSWLVALRHADRILMMNSGNINNFDLDLEYTPRVSQLVSATLMDILGNADFRAAIDFGSSCRAYVFEDPEEGPVAALWCYRRAVENETERPDEAVLALGGNLVEIRDMTDRAVPFALAEGRLTVPVTSCPRFYRCRPGSCDALCDAIRGATVVSRAAADAVWTGGSGRWSDAANWAGGRVPAAGDTVRVSNAVAGVTIELDVPDVSLRSIRFEGAGPVTLAGGHELTLTGAWAFKSLAGAGSNVMDYPNAVLPWFNCDCEVDCRVPLRFRGNHTESGICMTTRGAVFRKPIRSDGVTSFNIHNGFTDGSRSTVSAVTFEDEVVHSPETVFGPRQYPCGSVRFDGRVVCADLHWAGWQNTAVSLYGTGSSFRSAFTDYTQSIFAGAAGALPPETTLGLGGTWNNASAAMVGRINLGNFDTAIDRLDDDAFALVRGSAAETAGAGCLSSSDTPSGGEERPVTLTMNGTGDGLTMLKVTGRISLVWNPSGDFTQTFSNRTSTTTGTIEVRRGRVVLADGAAFPNVPDLVLGDGAEFVCGSAEADALAAVRTIEVGAGGVFRLTSSAGRALADGAVALVLGKGARVDLPRGMTVRFASVSCAGVPCADGDYVGRNSSTGLPPAEWVTGGGRVRVGAGNPACGRAALAFYDFRDGAAGESAVGTPLVNRVDPAAFPGDRAVLGAKGGELVFSSDRPCRYVYANAAADEPLAVDPQSLAFGSGDTPRDGIGARVLFDGIGSCLATNADYTIEFFWKDDRAVDPGCMIMSVTTGDEPAGPPCKTYGLGFYIQEAKNYALCRAKGWGSWDSTPSRDYYNGTDAKTSLCDGYWHHVALVHDSKTHLMTTHFDYSKSGTDRKWAITNGSPASASLPLLLGGDGTEPGTMSRSFHGKIACLRVSRACLARGEFLQASDSPEGPFPRRLPETVFHWRFEGVPTNAAFGAGAVVSEAAAENAGLAERFAGTSYYLNREYYLGLVNGDGLASGTAYTRLPEATASVAGGQVLAAGTSLGANLRSVFLRPYVSGTGVNDLGKNYGFSTGPELRQPDDPSLRVRGDFTMECFARLDPQLWEASQQLTPDGRGPRTTVAIMSLAGDGLSQSTTWALLADPRWKTLSLVFGTNAVSGAEHSVLVQPTMPSLASFTSDPDWLGGWHHYAVTYSESARTFRVYVDRRLFFETQHGGELAYGQTTQYCRVGCGGNASAWTGWLDEVRLVRRTLAPADFLEARAYGGVSHWSGAEDGHWTNRNNWVERIVPGRYAAPYGEREGTKGCTAVFGDGLDGAAETTVDFDGVYSISNLLTTGTHRYTYGTSAAQTVPIEPFGTFSAAETPETPAARMVAMLQLGVEVWATTYGGETMRVRNNSREEFTLGAWGGCFRDPASPGGGGEPGVRFEGTGDLRLGGEYRKGKSNWYMMAGFALDGKLTVDAPTLVRTLSFTASDDGERPLDVELTANGTLEPISCYNYFGASRPARVHGEGVFRFGVGIRSGAGVISEMTAWRDLTLSCRVDSKFIGGEPPASYPLRVNVGGGGSCLYFSGCDNSVRGVFQCANGNATAIAADAFGTSGTYGDLGDVSFVLGHGASLRHRGGVPDETDRAIVISNKTAAAATAALEQDGAGAWTVRSPVTCAPNMTGATLTLGGSSETSATFAGTLGSKVKVAKSGTATWRFDPQGGYSGDLAVSGGRLVVVRDLSLASLTAGTGASTVVVESGVTLTVGTLSAAEKKTVDFLLADGATVRVTSGTLPAGVTLNGGQPALDGTSRLVVKEGSAHIYARAVSGGWTDASRWAWNAAPPADAHKDIFVNALGGDYTVTLADREVTTTNLYVRNAGGGGTATLLVSNAALTVVGHTTAQAVLNVNRGGRLEAVDSTVVVKDRGNASHGISNVSSVDFNGGELVFRGTSKLVNYGLPSPEYAGEGNLNGQFTFGTGTVTFDDDATFSTDAATGGRQSNVFYHNIRPSAAGGEARVVFRGRSRLAFAASPWNLMLGGVAGRSVLELDSASETKMANLWSQTYVGYSSGVADLVFRRGSYAFGTYDVFHIATPGTDGSTTTASSLCVTGRVEVGADASLLVYGRQELTTTFGGMGVGQGVAMQQVRGKSHLRGELRIAGAYTQERGNFLVGMGPCADGEVTQTGGTANVVDGAYAETEPIGEVAIAAFGGTGRYNLAGGAFSTHRTVYVGGATTNDLHRPHKNGEFLVRQHDAKGVLSVTGGSFATTKRIVLGADGTGVLELSGTGVVSAPEVVVSNTVGQAASSLRFVLDGKRRCGALDPATRLVFAKGARLVVDAGAAPSPCRRVRVLQLDEPPVGLVAAELVGAPSGATLIWSADRRSLTYRDPSGGQVIVR